MQPTPTRALIQGSLDFLLKKHIDINKFINKSKINDKKTNKMLGICPNCKIKLKEPPFNNRETNEIILILNYRKNIENKIHFRAVEEKGFCELCRATKKDIEGQMIVG